MAFWKCLCGSKNEIWWASPGGTPVTLSGSFRRTASNQTRVPRFVTDEWHKHEPARTDRRPQTLHEVRYPISDAKVQPEAVYAFILKSIPEELEKHRLQ